MIIKCHVHYVECEDCEYNEHCNILLLLTELNNKIQKVMNENEILERKQSED